MMQRDGTKRRETTTTGIKITYLTEEQINHLKNVRHRVAELKQRTNRILNQ